jgi:transcription elongation factor Elf1
MKIIALMVVLFFNLSAYAEVTKIFRCGEPGKYTYSTVSCGTQAKQIDIETNRLSTDPDPYQDIVKRYREAQQEKRDLAEEDDDEYYSSQTPAYRKTSGLRLREFNKIRVEQSEAEVIIIAGRPEYESIDFVNTETGVTQKSYYYIKRGFNANVSRIIFRNGNVSEVQRKLTH